jgi:hypothetical protein
MKPSRSLVLFLVGVVLTFALGVSRLRAQAQQEQPANPPQAGTQKTAAPPQAQNGSATAQAQKEKAKEEDSEDENLFAPEPAPTLPPGMTGSNPNDPRYKLAPGLYNAGEAAMGLKHLLLVKKPAAFELGASDPDDPKVQKMVGQLGMGNNPKIPKSAHVKIAQLAFANSDLAFQGNHLFQGNFYGVSIYDISDPAHAKLLTTMVCPGGQGDV